MLASSEGGDERCRTDETRGKVVEERVSTKAKEEDLVTKGNTQR